MSELQTLACMLATPEQRMRRVGDLRATGCMELLDRCGVKLEGKHAVVLGRSTVVGIPLSLMLLHRNATVTTCHSKSQDVQQLCRQVRGRACACACARAQAL